MLFVLDSNPKQLAKRRNRLLTSVFTCVLAFPKPGSLPALVAKRLRAISWCRTDSCRDAQPAGQVPPDALGCEEPSYQLAPCEPQVLWLPNSDLAVSLRLRASFPWLLEQTMRCGCVSSRFLPFLCFTGQGGLIGLNCDALQGRASG